MINKCNFKLHLKRRTKDPHLVILNYQRRMIKKSKAKVKVKVTTRRKLERMIFWIRYSMSLEKRD